MCPYWLFSVLLLWETTAIIGITANEQWALRFALHQTLETALLNNPSNLFKLSEVFFPRRYALSPVSVRVTYNLTCQQPGNCSLQTSGINDNGSYTVSYAWSSLPFNRMDPFTFSILESLSQQYFGIDSVPVVELSLEIESLPCGASRQDMEDELLRISAMLKAYAKEQGIPPPNSKHKGYASSTIQLDHFRITEDLYSKLLTISHILVDCSLFFTFLSTGYFIYGTVYKHARGKKNPVYGLYWATVFFSADIFILTVGYYKTNAIMGPQLNIFLILELIVSVFIVCRSKAVEQNLGQNPGQNPGQNLGQNPGQNPRQYLGQNPRQNLGQGAWVQGYPDFPIPFVPAEFIRKCMNNDELRMSNRAIIASLYAVQVLALWFPVAVLHAFGYNIVDRVEVFMTFPLETFVEFVLYLIPAICFFVVLNILFYDLYNEEAPPQNEEAPPQNEEAQPQNEEAQPQNEEVQPLAMQNEAAQPSTMQMILKYCFSVIKVVNTLIALAVIWIVGISIRSLALTLSWSQDSEARLLVLVLIPVILTFVMAKAVWGFVKPGSQEAGEPSSQGAREPRRHRVQAADIDNAEE